VTTPFKQRVPIRAVTRNPNGDKARALVERGVEVIRADLEDADSVRAAFDGASAGFAMTTHNGPDGPRREVAHGRVIAAAASDAALPFLVYSSVGVRLTAVCHISKVSTRSRKFCYGPCQ
jgi:uncharacterized protein YbjT (DUF2867 family)